MEIEICSQCRGLVLDPGETVSAISNELDRFGNQLPTTLKVEFILYVVLGMVMIQIYVLFYFFG